MAPSPAMPEASRLTAAAAALSAVSAPLASSPGVAASAGVGDVGGGSSGGATALAADFAGFTLESAAALATIGRAISADFSGVTRMSCESWPYLASALASACAQLSPLRRQEQVESNDCWNLSALGIST